MDDPDIASSLAGADQETLEEILREAEAFLGAQLSAAIAADQRALTFSGFLAASIVVLVGATATFALASPSREVFAMASMIVAMAFTGSLYFAIRSAMPARFEFAGNLPGSWVADVLEKKTLVTSLAEQCANYDEKINDNANDMEENALLMRDAVEIAFGATVVGSLLFLYGLAAVLLE